MNVPKITSALISEGDNECPKTDTVATEVRYPATMWPVQNMCSRRESNPHQDLRRVLLYPLSYESVYLMNSTSKRQKRKAFQDLM